MATQDITTKYQQPIRDLISWASHLSEAERPTWLGKVKEIRRNMKKISFARSEKCSVATFGESQTGKSYLVNALLSEADKAFTVTDGERDYNFIQELNPSEKGVQREATGVVTRFSTTNRAAKPGYVEASLLSVADICLILCEAYYDQLEDAQVYTDFNEINRRLREVQLQATAPSPLHEAFTEDDVWEIRDYLESSSLRGKTATLVKSDFFQFLADDLRKLDDAQILELLTILWHDDPQITRLFRDLIDTYARLDYSPKVQIPFAGMLNRHGTLLDVRRLDEMYAPSTDALPDYRPEIEVTDVSGREVRVKKSFLSGLIAEIALSLPRGVEDSRQFLRHIDILDFPGARRSENMKADKLSDGANLSTILRRGKVTYLFNKYSAAKRISSLLLCHHNNQSAQSVMGGLMARWIDNNIGSTPEKRAEYIREAKVSPLFVVCTWFNKDLEHQDETPDSFLDNKWNTRFIKILCDEVLKTNNNPWFDNWTAQGTGFDNIYLLRDFYYSMKGNVFSGWSESTAETAEILPPTFPDFRKRLRESFINYDFVKRHFPDPARSWDEAASVRKDGTELIISRLNELAPHLEKARNTKFDDDITTNAASLMRLAESHYHSDSNEEELKKAQKAAAKAQMQLMALKAKNPFFFGALLDKMMVHESDIYERIFPMIETYEQPQMEVNEYVGMRADIGLNESATAEENLNRLLDYYGLDEETCRETLNDMGIDLDKLVAPGHRAKNLSDLIVASISRFWYEEILTRNIAGGMASTFSSSPEIVERLWRLFGICHLQDVISRQIDGYLKRYDRSSCIAMIADCIAMHMNRFVSGFGFDYLPKATLANIREKNDRLNWRLNMNDSAQKPDGPGIEILEEMDKIVELINNPRDPQNRAKLSRFPQFEKADRWINNMKIGFISSCEMPDYDLAANSSLGTIINTLKEAEL